MKLKGIVIQYVDSHYAIDGTGRLDRDGDLEYDPRLPLSAKRIWKRWGLRDSCTAGVVALDGDKIIGFCRLTNDGDTCLSMQGTWVDGQYRRAGLATAMWLEALRVNANVEIVAAIAVSKSGNALTSRLSQLRTDLEWDIQRPKVP